MTLNIRRIQAWAGVTADQLGSAAGKLDLLARAGARLELVFSGPHPSDPDKAVLYLAPISGPEQMQAAREVGLGPALNVAVLHIQGQQRDGLALEVMSRLAVAGVALRAMSVSTSDAGFHAYLAFDSAALSTTAVQVLATLDG
jgi:hypothetical protein